MTIAKRGGIDHFRSADNLHRVTAEIDHVRGEAEIARGFPPPKILDGSARLASFSGPE